PAAAAAATAGWGLDPATLLNPPADSWPTYHGDYTGQRHSRLTQITTANVHQLTLAWTFQTGQPAGIKSTPILVNGMMFITAPDNLWAIDARNGRQLWRYTYPTNQGFHIGHRGAAVYKDTVFLTTPDAHLVALNAADGKVKWDVVIADARKGFWSTNAPLDQRRGHRRADVECRHLRSAAEPALRRHRQPDASAQWPGASRRQPVDL